MEVFNNNSKEITEVNVASAGQHDIWLAENVANRANQLYSMGVNYELTGHIDVSLLEQAIKRTVSEHEAFRTSFATTEQGLVQHIHSKPHFDFSYIDLRHDSSTSSIDKRLNKALELCRDSLNEKFDLTKPELFRAKVYQVSDEKYVFSLTLHHIIFDNETINVILEEIAFYYSSLLRGDTELKAYSEDHFECADFALWQHDMLEGGYFTEHQQYWLNNLSNVNDSVNLNIGHVTKTDSQEGDMKVCVLDSEREQRVSGYCNSLSISQAVAYFTCFAALLYRLTGKSTLVFGVPVSLRDEAELEYSVGFFINVVPVKVELSSDTTFSQLSQQISDSLYQAMVYKQYPYNHIVADIAEAKESSQKPLFDIMFNYFTGQQIWKLEGTDSVQHEILPCPMSAKFPLTLFAIDTQESIEFWFEYQYKHIDSDYIDTFIQAYLATIDIMVAKPDTLVNTTLLSSEAAPLITDFKEHNSAHQLLVLNGAYQQQIPGVLGRLYIKGMHYQNGEWLLSKDEQLFDTGIDAWVELNNTFICIDNRTHEKAEFVVDNFDDFVIWYEEYRRKQDIQASERYWYEIFEGCATKGVVERHNHKSDECQRASEQVVLTELPKNIVSKLEALADHNQVNLKHVLDGALAVLLSRCSYSQDVVFCTRDTSQSGETDSPLVLRVDTRFAHFSELLADIKKRTQRALVEQTSHIHNLLSDNSSSSIASVCKIKFEMASSSEQDLLLSIGGQEICLHLAIVSQFHDGDLRFSWRYDTSLVEPGVVEQLAQNFLCLLENTALSSNLEIRNLSVLQDQETSRLIESSGVTLPLDESIKQVHHLFEAQAKLRPFDLAIKHSSASLSYKEVDEAANRLAHHMHLLGVANGSLIGIALPRSVDLVIGVLAILKAGGVYVPLDLSLPQRRLQHILNDTAMQFVLGNKEGLDSLCLSDGVLVIDIDSELTRQDVQVCPTTPLNTYPEQDANSAVNVIYTSGTTGNPKGVIQTHRTLINLVVSTGLKDGIQDSLRTLQFTPISFDVSAQELATSWYTGSPLIIIDQKQKDNLNVFASMLKDEAIERLFVPPAVLQVLAEQLPELACLREVIVAGEALSNTPEISSFMERHPQCKLWNHYGPTETHVATTALIKDFHPEATPPIGKPVANCSTYILDSQLALVPFGYVGELYIAGAGLAKGYLNQSELTNERFVECSLYEGHHERLYKTGDLVKYSSKGDIEYVGRTDDQVKIRGFRIELAEIESHLLACEGVSHSVVTVNDSDSSNKFLVAYISQSRECALSSERFISSLNEQLEKSLPSYMIPSHIVVIDTWPLTPNGKINKRELPSDFGESDEDCVSPQGEVQLALAEIVCDLLHLEISQVCMSKSFLQLGAHSLLVIKLITRISNEFSVEFEFADIFEMSSLILLSSHIEECLEAQLLAVDIPNDEVVEEGWI